MRDVDVLLTWWLFVFVAQIVYQFQGQRVHEDDTPDKYNMPDGTCIDAFVRELAGGW